MCEGQADPYTEWLVYAKKALPDGGVRVMVDHSSGDLVEAHGRTPAEVAMGLGCIANLHVGFHRAKERRVRSDEGGPVIDPNV